MTTPEPAPEDLAREVLDEIHVHLQLYGPDGRHANGEVLRSLRPFLLPIAARTLAAEAEVAALKARLLAAYDRVAAQAELLSRRAEVPGG